VTRILILVLALQAVACTHLEEALCDSKTTLDEYDACMDRLENRKTPEPTYCQQQVKARVFKSLDECDYAQDHPEAYACHKSDLVAADREKCLWRLDHPIEAKCEEAAKVHGGYWDCVRIEREAHDRKRQLQADQHGRARDRRDRQEELDDERRREAAKELRKAFAPAKQTRCVTRRGYSGTMETVCEDQ